MTVHLYLLQRATAVLMLPLIAGHIAMIFYATRQGVSAADILRRTQGSLAWGAYYGVFVLAAAAHAAIGVRTVAMEWLGAGRQGATRIMWGLGTLLLILGLRAVAAVVAT